MLISGQRILRTKQNDRWAGLSLIAGVSGEKCFVVGGRCRCCSGRVCRCWPHQPAPNALTDLKVRARRCSRQLWATRRPGHCAGLRSGVEEQLGWLRQQDPHPPPPCHDDMYPIPPQCVTTLWRHAAGLPLMSTLVSPVVITDMFGPQQAEWIPESPTVATGRPASVTPEGFPVMIGPTHGCGQAGQPWASAETRDTSVRRT